jgi:pimeloyl-ACP methyl ester carboxylesterase
MTARERTLDLPGHRVAAIEWGPEDAQPVLALHGWLDNAASFARLAPMLESLHLVALDLPGHGRSDGLPAVCSRHFVDWVPVVLEAADAIGWQRFSLLGHSMGAGISTLVPAVARERIERLVLVEGMGPLSSPAEGAPEQLAKALRSEVVIALKEPSVHQDLEAAIAARMKNSDLDHASARLMVERGVEQIARGVRFTFDPRLKTSSRMRLTEEQVLAFLERIECPVLAVRATEGWPFPEQIVARRLGAIADLRTAQVEGGHHVHLTNPERVAPLIREFVGV